MIALGGSLVVPSPGKINTDFLKIFRRLILGFTKKDYKFIIVTGGGKTSRTYQKAAYSIARPRREELDRLGISATKINAELVRIAFGKEAFPTIFDNPAKPIPKNIKKYNIFIASGCGPGWSTDYISVLLAKKFKVKTVIDAGNVPFVFNKDCNKYKGAKPIRKLTWKEYRKMINQRWVPGLAAPVDPVAAKAAQKFGIEALVLLGTDIANLKKAIENKAARGTIIANGALDMPGVSPDAGNDIEKNKNR